MKKSKRLMRAAALCAISATLAGVVVPLAGCPDSNKTVVKENPEVRPLTMSIQTPDGVFNPFFSTSAYDSSILGMTQIGMLTADKNGKVACGDNEPVVVKQYTTTTLAEDGKTETKVASDIAYTRYDFVLKNDVKFSDGTPLTIKDVLFNLYVYLDPLYTGSSTIYSTKIVGLEQYRKQDPNATSDSLSSFEDGFISDAIIRVQELAEFIRAYGMYSPAVGETRPDKNDSRWDEPAEKQGYIDDYKLVASEFLKELNTDWNSTEGSMETYLKWGFTDVWQVYLMNDGQESDFLARYESGEDEGQLIQDDEGNYKMNETYAAERELDLKDYLAEQGITATEGDAYKNAVKQWSIDSVYMSYFPTIADVDAQIAATNANNFVSILNAWATGQEIRTQFTARAKSDYYSSHERVVPTIKGVDGTKTVTLEDGETYEVLSITIHDIDPKAIWNFSFNVSPMHYYSGTFEGKDYVKAAMEKGEAQGEFGLKFGSKEFMDEVINAPNKIGLPVGGGAYMASSSAGTPARNGDDFFDANIVYYQRNPYFYTLGGSDVESESQIKNAKIKYVRYKVVNADQVLGSVIEGAIDIGDPSATQENVTKAEKASNVAHKEVKTNGYGYVGINPRFVPNITVRRAIMKAMDTSIIFNNYYKNGLAEPINRPMSTVNWAYPQGCTVYKNDELGLDYSFDKTAYDIEQMIIDEGYIKVGGIYQKNIEGFGVDKLEYEFTIAGASTDHPAYAMFMDAMTRLNKIGFKIRVVTSQTALSDLATGKLTVWAAAWSSTIDPDMYQVYHKDSSASSVNNWGYPQIKQKKTTTYAQEWSIINELSALIDAGRETNEQEGVNGRIAIYHKALDKVMELAVEMPTYQRTDMTAYNKNIIDPNTVTPESEITSYNGVFSRLWEVNYYL